MERRARIRSRHGGAPLEERFDGRFCSFATAGSKTPVLYLLGLRRICVRNRNKQENGPMLRAVVEAQVTPSSYPP